MVNAIPSNMVSMSLEASAPILTSSGFKPQNRMSAVLSNWVSLSELMYHTMSQSTKRLIMRFIFWITLKISSVEVILRSSQQGFTIL